MEQQQKKIMMEKNDNIRAIDSIVKASDDNTREHYQSTDNTYLYNIMLSHIEHIESNLYNFKFIGRILNAENTKEIYMNLQILINDSSIITNSKYYIEDPNRLLLVNSYKFDKKENASNSYRIDFSIGNSYKDGPYCKLQLVNMVSNTSSYIGLPKSIFFKISIFMYQLLNFNIIDGNILQRSFKNLILLSGEQSYIDAVEENIKIFTFYWNYMYIIVYIDPKDEYQLYYMVFTKKEYENLMRRYTNYAETST